jgi:hypothetical protein
VISLAKIGFTFLMKAIDLKNSSAKDILFSGISNSMVYFISINLIFAPQKYFKQEDKTFFSSFK